MSQENEEITREDFEALQAAMNARDFDTVAELVGPHVEIHSVVAAADGAGSYRGIDGLRKWAEDVDAVWEDWHQEVVDYRVVSKNRAVAITRVTGRARTSGVPLDARTGNVLTRSPDGGSQLRAYSDPHEAFEAVGLRELRE
jgi:ketosteroid isomerase-like protein